MVLHLLHRLARPGHVREIGALRDDAVEAEHLKALEPHLRLLHVARDLRQFEARHVLLQERSPFGQRTLVKWLAVPKEHVERDELRGRLRGEFADARLGGMEAQLHEIELEPPVLLDDDLAVERGVRRHPLTERTQLREVAKERTAVATPQTERTSVVLEHAAEPIPLRLVPDVRSGRHPFDEQRLLRREWHARSCGRDDLVRGQTACRRIALRGSGDAHVFTLERDGGTRARSLTAAQNASAREGPRLETSACARAYFVRFARTESFACLAMRNLSTRFAGIEIASPVAGLRPILALRSTTTSLPTPGNVNPFRASLYASIASSSSTVATCFFARPVFSDNRLSVSDFEIPATSSSNVPLGP